MWSDRTRLRSLYKGLLRLYPRPFQERFGESMLQTFTDLYHERQAQPGSGLAGFVLWTFFDTAIGIGKEQLLRIRQGDPMQTRIINPHFAALSAFLLTLPLLLLNTIANKQIEPLSTFFKVNTAGGFWDYPVGHLSLIGALVLLPCGAIIALRPMWQRESAGGRKVYPLNLLLALLLLALFCLISGAFLEEIYRCNILQVPNCD